MPGELRVCTMKPAVFQSCKLGLISSYMKTLALLVIHVLTTLAQRAGPGGAKAIIAESVLLKHQQLIARRSAGKTPRLTTSDRFLCGFLTLFMRPGRIRKAAVVLKPATLTKFRRALVSRNYRLLFSSHKKGKPGPKGPSDGSSHC